MVTKLHEGELIELLKKRSGFSYEQIAESIDYTSRQLNTFRRSQNLGEEIKDKLAQFFSIDVRAFTDSEVRKSVLKKYMSPNVRNTVSENEVPVRVEKIEKKVDLIADDMQILKEQLDRLLKQLKKR